MGKTIDRAGFWIELVTRLFYSSIEEETLFLNGFAFVQPSQIGE